MIKNRSKTVTADGLEKCCFFYSKGMQDNWIESSNIFLDYVESNFGQSVKALLIEGELVVTEVDESLIPKFETAEAEVDYLSKLKY